MKARTKTKARAKKRRPKPIPPRFRVDTVEFPGDTDDPKTMEFRVVDIATDRVVLKYEEWMDLWHPWDPSYEGVSSVVLDDDGAHVIVKDHDGSVARVAIPS
jgi:hypothetical protein